VKLTLAENWIKRGSIGMLQQPVFGENTRAETKIRRVIIWTGAGWDPNGKGKGKFLKNDAGGGGEGGKEKTSWRDTITQKKKTCPGFGNCG